MEALALAFCRCAYLWFACSLILLGVLRGGGPVLRRFEAMSPARRRWLRPFLAVIGLAMLLLTLYFPALLPHF